MDVSKSENLTVLNQNNNVQEMLNNEIQNNEILSLSEDNTTLSASNTDNDGALGAPDSGTFVNLRNKINNASSGSTVLLENNYNFGSYSSDKGIYINKNLIIDGQGYTIDANNGGRIFNITTINYNITLKNIVFKNAMYGSGAGGAIYFKGTNLTVENCTFESNKNHHSKGGGAIYVDYNDKVLINIVNSTFSKNNVSSVGGALYFDNPLSLQGQFDVYITNCDFNENYAACNRNNAYGGGAIFVFELLDILDI